MTESPGVFIVGTDTGVGKTYVSALILRELRELGIRVGAYKPACSGAEIDPQGRPQWTDLETLARAAHIKDVAAVCPYRLLAPLAPPVAARLENVEIQEDVIHRGFIRARNGSQFTVVEGVGGLLCPLTESQTIADFAKWTRLPVIVVSRLGLGAINHTMLTLEVAKHRQLHVVGIVMNDANNEAGTPAGQTNAAEIQRLTAVPILGVLSFHGNSLCLWRDMSAARIDWQKLGSCHFRNETTD